jgi:quinol monooxygenase YgiN
MSQIVIIGQFDIHPEDASAAELMRVMMNETMKEHGCRHYSYSRDLSTANRFQLSELWENEEALAGHFRANHMATYRAGMAKLRVQKRTVRRYDASARQRSFNLKTAVSR